MAFAVADTLVAKYGLRLVRRKADPTAATDVGW
jgi:hypothetical protein